MFGQTYYHGTLRKYVILFGTLFNNLWINRTDNNGNVVQSFKVPVSYGPREKTLARIETMSSYSEFQEDPVASKDPQEIPFSMTLPRMSFEMTGFSYAGERKLSTVNRFARKDNAANQDQSFYNYNPVPYDINFSLSIFVKNTSDGTMLVEQILPYFTPEWTTTVQLLETPDITLDVPLVMTDISQDDVYEGSFEERRALIWTIGFTMKGYLFGPTRKQEIIKLANTQLYAADGLSIEEAIGVASPDARLSVQPGQTADGQPTTDITQTIDKSEISKDEPWDYIVTKEDPVDPPQ